PAVLRRVREAVDEWFAATDKTGPNAEVSPDA
ncbi:MAG: hypothetical protein ACI8U4_003119, partial [Natronomonas sp.]